jgi:hypothetical protein
MSLVLKRKMLAVVVAGLVAPYGRYDNSIRVKVKPLEEPKPPEMQGPTREMKRRLRQMDRNKE